MTERDVTAAYEQYGHLVLRRCRRILRDAALAEDAMQDVFYKLWRYGDSFLTADSKVSWLARCADRCCFDALGRQRTIERVAEVVTGAELSQSSVPGADVDLAERQALLRVLDRFEPRVQQALVLHHVGELTLDEIALATNWSRQTVAKKLDEAHQRARRLRSLEEAR
jgi:RNA polymerase sigma-70 factor (ECF subfamily)